ncbi:squalene/phytoene synthase family protein [Streptomyces sp. PTM05]|uniref:Squalene/phytoene synthase family protein n=1 Tax=Streptantibioticus parmotrematis TaxID=2873249 RepID=A0ABS7QRU7_9ACTN|nr:squalene/phytoene synthase family protein [Streptantibioticus parmotrematis]MBY8884534.1 squalene/phytoene synthase family protein [Streptantibioticus parmotrematis]
MGAWEKSLDAAGVRDAALRADYTRQREVVVRFKRDAYLAALLLLPRELLPHVVAATAFMHTCDNLLDSGPKEGRAQVWEAWEREVRAGLADGSAHPDLRALLHSAALRPRLGEQVDAYLGTARADLDFTGFATEADHRRYVERYSLPAFLLVACLLEPEGDAARAAFRTACRTYIDAAQRLDFVNDLAEDLATGRLTLPLETLERFGVTRDDLEAARDTPATRELVAYVQQQVRDGLAASRRLIADVPPVGRPLLRALTGLDALTLTAARAEGAGLLRGPAKASKPGTAAVLLREWVNARRGR